MSFTDAFGIVSAWEKSKGQGKPPTPRVKTKRAPKKTNLKEPEPGEIISNKEAKARGLDYFFTGKPCKRGHTSLRYIKGMCVACAKEYRDKYHEARRNGMKYSVKFNE